MAELRIPVPDIGFRPPVYSCIRAKEPLVLDGNIEKSFWEAAPFTDCFVDIEGDKREKPRFTTRVKMMWDDENLYIGAVLEGDEIWATLTERDCVIFYDNDFEIFIDPDSDTHQYFEFEMNALGTVWDLMLTKPYRDFGGSTVNGWDIHGLKCAVFIDGELNSPGADNRRWMAEVVIPFDALKEGNGGKKPAAGDYYRVNFSRVQWDVETEDGRYKKLPKPEHNWVWAPTGLINIHYPELWGFVFFTENGEACRIPEDEKIKWELRRLYYAQHGYYDSHKRFAEHISQLTGKMPSLNALEMETTAHSFELRCESFDGLHEIILFSDGKTWTEEKVTERGCLSYLYRFMPLSDAADYPEELFKKFVRHACMVRELVPWGDRLNLELFLNYVLQYRINNEDIEFYSEEFFNEIYPRIQGRTMYEAALEVNYWCFEKATYQSTDIRTASPFTVIRNAYGRCGEESALAVAALRSVGIPARQSYTPRWAHCDDNHAWVEVWIDGEWHFLGACEPEARLDMGWFRLPASKGMLIHNRVLTDRINDEVITRQTGHYVEINGLSRYAETKQITVTVRDGRKHPVSGACVRFEVVNFSEFYPLAALETNCSGQVSFLTGLGDLMIYAYKDGACAFEKMDVRSSDRLTLVLDGVQPEKEEVNEQFVPPAGGIKEDEPFTAEEDERHRARMEQAVSIRRAFEETFYHDDGKTDRKTAEILKNSRGNYRELLAFLNDEETNQDCRLKIRLLQSLEKKDLTDITAEILKEHFQYALPYAAGLPEDLFCEAVLCPRVWIEPIRLYRRFIQEYFGAGELNRFAEDPSALVAWIKENIVVYDEPCYANLSTSPPGLLRVKKGNEISGRILFVAVLRTAGVPAKLDRADLSCMYYRNGEWKRLFVKKEEAERDAVFVLKKKPDEELEYLKNYTVSFQREGVYRTLDFKGIPWTENEIRFDVPSGPCRVVLSERLPCGTNLVRVYHRELPAGKETHLDISLPKAQSAGKEIPLQNLAYKTLEGEPARLHDDLGSVPGMVMWLSVGEEPTEHLLNELIEAKEAYNRKKPSIVLILKRQEDMADPTLQKVLHAVPFVKVRAGYRTEELSDLFDAFGINDKRLPFAVAAKDKAANFAWSGYNVGIGDLLLKNME